MGAARAARASGRRLFQIAVLDIVFSLDSVLTAIGMADEFAVMAAAVVIAVGLMIFAAGPVGRFIRENPTVKMLALAFLLLIGVTLVADGAGYDIPKGFIYSAVGFSLMVEGLNQWARRRAARGRISAVKKKLGAGARLRYKEPRGARPKGPAPPFFSQPVRLPFDHGWRAAETGRSWPIRSISCRKCAPRPER